MMHSDAKWCKVMQRPGPGSPDSAWGTSVVPLLGSGLRTLGSQPGHKSIFKAIAA